MNQANNFWDFVASLQNNSGAFPFAEGRGPSAEFDPFEGQQFWGPWAQRGRGRGPHGHGPHGHGRRGPPPPAGEGHESHGPSGNESDGPAPPRGPGPHAHHHHGPRGPHAHPHGPPHHHGRGGHRGPPPPEHDGAMPPPPPPFDEPLSRSPTPPTPPETPAEPHHHPRSQSPRHHRGPSPHHHGPRHHRGPSPQPKPSLLVSSAVTHSAKLLQTRENRTQTSAPTTTVTAHSPLPSICSAHPQHMSSTLLSLAPRNQRSMSPTLLLAIASPSPVS